MDVKCERCNTEYEFDDALVSGRGTTVKCTNCGHKFKIRRSDGDFSEDFWNVTTGDGRTLVFTSLRELQRAIQGYLVERNDRLSRGGLPPKAIGQIPELAPFFEQREAKKTQQQTGRSVKTQDGLGPAAAAAVTTAIGHAAISAPGPLPSSQASPQVSQPPPLPMRPRQATKPEFPAPPSDQTPGPAPMPNYGKSTLIGTGPVSNEEAFSNAPATVREPEPHTTRLGADAVNANANANAPRPAPPVPKRESMNTVPIQRPTPPPPTPAPVAASAAPQQTASSAPPRQVNTSNPPPLPDRAKSRAPNEPPRAPPLPAGARSSESNVRSAQAVDNSSPLPPPLRQRSLLAEIEEERDRTRGPSTSVPDFNPPQKRRSVGGFIVAAVVVGCLLMLGAVWAQKNLGVTLGGKPPAPPAPTVDPRVVGFITTGEQAMADGNFEIAKENLDKASALSEKDPHVLLGLARLAAMRADVLWLKSRLLPAEAADDHRITRDELTPLAANARKAADDALAVAPDDAGALRAKIDALRISGDRDGARALVGKVTPSAAQPESAYVLAALDLAEVEPLWPTVIERLKIASSAETGPGRARAALVFALARSGDGAGAKAEVERLVAMPKAHPLLSLLRGFADRAKPAAKLDGGVAGDAGPTFVLSGMDAGHSLANIPGTPTGTSGGVAPTPGIPSDPREMVAQANRAQSKGDLERAKTLFTAASEKNPNDSEALTGLASIAYAQRDLNGARAAYKRVLAINPNYMPAVVGLADVEWDSGNKDGATKMYKDIVDRYPEGTYPARAKQRSEGGG